VSKETPINIEVIKVIYKAILPTYYKLESLLKNLDDQNLQISQMDKALMLDVLSCSLSLKCMFEQYMEEAYESSANQLFLPEKEFNAILQMSKLVESSTRMKFGNIAIWSN
tara:strand:+ start:3715 stop:4047 length:333 start_codon:yes stop_codon:yes gene_type:complete